VIRLRWRRGSLPQPREEPRTEAAPGQVRGERAEPIAAGARSLQARMSSLLAAGLMTSVGAAMLTWYYAAALPHRATAHRRPAAAVPEAPGGGMTLPPFGHPTLPAGARAEPPAAVRSMPAAAPQAGAQSAAALPAGPLLEPPLARAPGEPPRGYGGAGQPSPRRQRLDRRLSGEVFAAGPEPGAPQGGGRGGPAPVPAQRADALQTLLRPTVLTAGRARLLPDQHLLLPQGTFIDCTLETAIDSTLPGMTTCVTATDTFSADGTVVLLERGTKLIGETRGEIHQGQARMFVVWTEARTPGGVVVRLDSPGTDALGRSGLEGAVNRHFWQRFGAAALVSTIDGAVQSRVQSSSRSGTVVLDPTASEDVLTGILRSTVDIAPTIRVGNGARIQVLVARDVDFRPVYALEAR
jgi:type IV secretion system protein VirB10